MGYVIDKQLGYVGRACKHTHTYCYEFFAVDDKQYEDPAHKATVWLRNYG